ncbi:MAG: hypothetical protein LUE87_00510, partial [Lachnospiraceae bacterium]|nr:hypothetical protein [Lachnospiraceae bacterium]
MEHAQIYGAGIFSLNRNFPQYLIVNRGFPEAITPPLSTDTFRKSHYHSIHQWTLHPHSLS